MKTCKPNTLITGPHFCIAQCQCCQRIGLYYKNILCGFSENEFLNFGQSVCQMNFREDCVGLPNREAYVVINTCHKDIQFAFSESEFDELCEALQQSIILLEAHAILKGG